MTIERTLMVHEDWSPDIYFSGKPRPVLTIDKHTYELTEVCGLKMYLHRNLFKYHPATIRKNVGVSLYKQMVHDPNFFLPFYSGT